MSRIAISPAVFFFFSVIAPAAYAVSISPGDIIVTDADADATFIVNPFTGNRSMFSGPGVGSGPNFVHPEGLVFDAEA